MNTNSEFNMPDYSYQDTISFLAKTKSEKIFKNKGTHNAEIVLSEIFNNSKEEVLLFSGNSKGDVTNSDIYNSAVLNYLENTVGSVNVFLENKLNEDNLNFKVYQTLKEKSLENNNRIQIKLATPSFLAEITEFFTEKYHFLVADRRIFRVETDSNSYKAICCFNSVEFCSKLSSIFNRHFQAAVI